MIEKRCGTCKYYKMEHKLRARTKGTCEAPIPECVIVEDWDSVYSDDGAKCPAWRLPVSDSMTYGPGGKPKKGAK